MKSKAAPFLTVCMMILFSHMATADDEIRSTQQASRLRRQVPVRMNYLLSLPKNYDSQPAWPLMLFLHGGGERGDDLELVKRHGPPKLIAAGKEFPFIVVSPQCPPNRSWQPVELAALLDEIVEKHNVDKDRIWVTGLSLGGLGTWSLAAFQPNRFAAIVPICGGGEKYWTKRIPHLATWAFHGAKDKGIPVARAQVMIDGLNSRGGKAKLTVYPDVGHICWPQAYADPELYDWLLKQKRRDATTQE